MRHFCEPLVYLVGAGPGSPGLLTLRAVECLKLADLVLHDRLVPTRILDYAPPAAQRICVTDLAERHVERCFPVHETMIQAARDGKRVVRLKGGDPFIFGRGGEEAEVLRAAGIPYEIVPGITAGLAAAVYAGIPLTHRVHSSAVALVTGHENSDKNQSTLDWSVLAHFPGTLVVYMGVARLREIVQALLANGKPGTTPAAVVERAGTGAQRTVETTLANLPEKVAAAMMVAPAIVIIGPVVGLRPQLAWFEERPLFGLRVLVTRPRHQAEDLVSRLETLGAVPVIMPALEMHEPADWSGADRALRHLSEYQWLVFTSANGVHALMARLRVLGRDLRALGSLQLASIGPATAEALGSYYLKADLVPSEFRSESLAANLKEKVAGKRVLLARADRGRDLLRLELSAVASVDQITVYAQVDALNGSPQILEAIRRDEIDYVTLTSSNIARAFDRMLDSECRTRILSGRPRLVSISPVTSGTLGELALPVAVEASEYTAGGLIDALVSFTSRLNHDQGRSRSASQDR